jgi:hypothetical protein
MRADRLSSDVKGRNMHPSNSSHGVPISPGAVKSPAARRFRRPCSRSQRRRSHVGDGRGGGRGRGELPVASAEVTARLLAEGVPAAEIAVVAAEIKKCIRLASVRSGPTAYHSIHPLTADLVEKYGDKLCTLLMTVRGGRLDRA